MDTAAELNLENTINENVMQVDENNWPVGPVSRKEMRINNLWHRASYIYVSNSKNELCIHLRSKDKEYCPDQWDLCAGGCMNYGKTDLENAKKELGEEYGVTGVDLEFVCCVPIINDISRSYLSIFLAKWDGDIKIQEEEVQEYRWVSVKELEDEYVNNKDVRVKAEGLQIFEMLRKHYNYLC